MFTCTNFAWIHQNESNLLSDSESAVYESLTLQSDSPIHLNIHCMYYEKKKTSLHSELDKVTAMM